MGTLVIFVWATIGQRYLNGHIGRYQALTHRYDINNYNKYIEAGLFG